MQFPVEEICKVAFQFTHPHGVRLTLFVCNVSGFLFQFTHPHGVRQQGYRYLTVKGLGVLYREVRKVRVKNRGIIGVFLCMCLKISKCESRAFYEMLMVRIELGGVLVGL